MQFTTTILLLTCLCAATFAQVKIENDIATPVIVYKQRADELKQICKSEGAPLDLMFVIDSSGSLLNRWQEQLQIVRDVINQVAVGPDATRVAIVQYSTRPITRFVFNTLDNRQSMLDLINEFTTTGATTMTGVAMEHAYNVWKEENGMRPDSQGVKRLLFLLSDGRSSDYPKDVEWAQKMRTDKRVEFYTFGLGDYIDWMTLRRVATGFPDQGYDRVVNSQNASEIVHWFEPWKGVTICEDLPVCVPGSSRPLDLMFVVDISSSVEAEFNDSVNFVRRTLNNVNVHPDATRVALITYSSTATVIFSFKDPRTQNNTGVLNVLKTLVNTQGVTRTAEALQLALRQLDPTYGARDGVKKLVIVITDGHSSSPPKLMAQRLAEIAPADIFAIALDDNTANIDRSELKDIATDNLNRVFPVNDRVFIRGYNLEKFESALLNYTDKACPGLNITGPEDAIETTLMPFETVCNDGGMRITLRTLNDFNGRMYAVGYDTKDGCSFVGSGQKETKMSLAHNSCGMRAVKVEGGIGDKYNFTVKIGLRFHPVVDTAADTYFIATCTLDGTPSFVKDNEVGNLVSARATDASCHYRVKPRSRGCELLDSEVGNIIEHEWSCTGLNDNQFIYVHDCVADGDSESLQVLSMLNSDGCQVDEYLMETPVYSKKNPHTVTRRTYMFKFPSETIVRHRCLISICDTDVKEGTCSGALTPNAKDDTEQPTACLQEFPEAKKTLAPTDLVNYVTPTLRPGWHATFGVEARRINVFQQDDLTGVAESNQRRFCSSFY